MIALFVDDSFISGSTLEIVQNIKATLSERYSKSVPGEVGQIRECEVAVPGIELMKVLLFDIHVDMPIIPLAVESFSNQINVTLTLMPTDHKSLFANVVF